MAGHIAPKERVAAVRLRADDARQRLEARRPSNTVVDTLFRAVQLDREAGGALLAGAIAFRFFMFLIPCVFLVVFGLGLGADVAGADPRDVAQHAGITGIAAIAINSGADTSDATRWLALAAAAFATFFGARNLLRVMSVSHALIWKVPYQRPRHGAVAVLTLMGVIVGLVALIRAVAALRDHTFIGWLLGLLLFALVPAAIWLLGSARLFPARPGVTWLQVLPGALLFGVGVELLHVVTVLWISKSIEAKSETYGAIGAALTLLLWAYLLGRIVTSAAMVNAAFWSARQRAHA